MIQATDLRIGNLIQLIYESKRPSLEERIVRVDRIDEMGVEILENGARVFGSVYELLEGIPLTEEILLKCGFDKCEMDGDYWFEYRNEPLRLVSNDTIFNNNTDKWVIGFDYYEGDTEFLDNKIQYLHQLQNLYYALTNTELTITL